MKTVNDWLVTSICVMFTACGVISCTRSDEDKAVAGKANYHIMLYTPYNTLVEWDAVSIQFNGDKAEIEFIESETGKEITISGSYVVEKRN